jgi:predicted RNA-binding Zn ribbon-like protein
MKAQEAPGRLEIIRAFINSRDLEQGTDTFTTLAGVRAWLHTHLSDTAAVVLTEADRDQLVDLRESLRAAAALNTATHAQDRSDRWLSAANEIAARYPIRLRFSTDGVLQPDFPPEDSAAVLTRLLWIVTASAVDGTWIRLKICPAADCRWAFYDHAKNRMGVWCQMSECGNRRKIQDYRARQRTSARATS